jgi:shikimate 5-dehydrogenase
MLYKVLVMTECDYVTNETRAINAINTISIRKEADFNRTLNIGTNTDAIGMWMAFPKSFLGIFSQSYSRSATVISGGCACRSAIYALWTCFGVSGSLS